MTMTPERLERLLTHYLAARARMRKDPRPRVLELRRRLADAWAPALIRDTSEPPPAGSGGGGSARAANQGRYANEPPPAESGGSSGLL